MVGSSSRMFAGENTGLSILRCLVCWLPETIVGLNYLQAQQEEQHLTERRNETFTKDESIAPWEYEEQSENVDHV